MGAVVVRKIRDGTSKTVLSKESASLPPPGRQDAAPRRCGVAPFASGPPPPLPPAPQRPCPFGIRALLARLHPHTPRPRGNGDSRRSSAAGAAHRAPTSSSCSAPRKTPLAGSPRPVCDAPLARPILATRRPRAPPRPPAASCAMHCTPLRARPPRDTRTPHLRRRAHPPEPAATCVATAFVALTARIGGWRTRCRRPTTRHSRALTFVSHACGVRFADDGRSTRGARIARGHHHTDGHPNHARATPRRGGCSHARQHLQGGA